MSEKRYLPRISEAFDDTTVPCAVEIIDLIHKAAKHEPFTERESEWLYILLIELYDSHEFRLRLRLIAVENELTALRAGKVS